MKMLHAPPEGIGERQRQDPISREKNGRCHVVGGNVSFTVHPQLAGLPRPLIKRCPKCGETKPREAFYRSAKQKDGCGPWCILCSAKTASAGRKRRWGAPAKKRDLRGSARYFGDFDGLTDEARLLASDSALHDHRGEFEDR